jgi:hypothetical protein
MAEDTGLSNPVKTGIKFAGEYVVPGGSNLVKGDLKQAGLHAVAGLVARVAFGLPGLLLVSVNSLTKATTGRHLYEHLGLDDNELASENELAETRIPPKTPKTA